MEGPLGISAIQLKAIDEDLGRTRFMADFTFSLFCRFTKKPMGGGGGGGGKPPQKSSGGTETPFFLKKPQNGGGKKISFL